MKPMLAEPALLSLGFLLLVVLMIGAVLVAGAAFLWWYLQRGLGLKAPPPVQPPPVAPATQVMPRKCPQCNAALQPDVPEGLCPACLLQRGIATEGGAPPGTPPFVPPTIPELTKLFPQLEILELIGKGGMGAVYKARQPALDRFVALKILAPRSGGDLDFAGRFTREARALARLSHPNIVGVYDFGEKPGHRPDATAIHYFIMEFVDGPNLRQAGRLSPRVAMEIIPQICIALQFAHDEGIVHRDIKPENVLLDKKGRVKIADFGLAKILGQEPKEIRLTGAKDIMGTPHYMAPEQVERPQDVDHRADIYSLGVVFYEMLTGELPLGKFQSPSQKVAVDVRLDEVVLRSLAKEPELRYQHVSEMGTRVEAIASSDAPAAPTNAEAFVREVQQRDYALNIGSCLSRGWRLVKNNFWPLVGMNALVFTLIGVAAAAFNWTSKDGQIHNTAILSLLLNGPLLGGLNLYFLKKLRGERATVETAFAGFKGRFLHLFLANFVATVLVVLGTLCLILPGLYLFVAWIFALTLVVDKNLDFWTALELSRKIVTKHWFKMFGFLLVQLLLCLSGAVVFCIGFFIASPIALAAGLYAYEDITSPAKLPSGSAASVPPIPPPDRFWRRFAVVMACVILIPAAIAIVGILAAIAIPNFVKARNRAQAVAAHNQRALAEPNSAVLFDHVGQTWFPKGDSIEILSVERSEKEMTVKGLYNLISADNARLALYVTSTNDVATQEASIQSTRISKGTGDFELVYPHRVSGLPHVTMYSADGKGFADVYFGSKDEADAESKLELGKLSSSAETWSPALASGEKPDLQKILAEAKTLVSQGLYEEALQRHLWYHNHALEFDQGQTGVRLSFALSDWVELGRHYPKARQAMMEMRDEKTREIQEGRGYFDLFMEVSALNRELQNDDATYALFKTIEQQDRQLARQCYGVAEGLLAERGEYDLCLSYIGDPQAKFDTIRQSWERMKNWEDQRDSRLPDVPNDKLTEYRNVCEILDALQKRKQFLRLSFKEQNPRVTAVQEQIDRNQKAKAQLESQYVTLTISRPELPKFADNNFVSQSRQLIEILVATDHKTDAEKIRDQAVAVLDDARLKSAVSDAEQKMANRAGKK